MRTKTLPDPWSYLRQHPDLTLVWADLPGRLRGCTDGQRIIWLDRNLLQRERRCTLTHELVHVRHHHIGRQPQNVENRVREETARILLPDVGAIVDALSWGHTWTEIAEDLWVTDDTLMCRLTHLTSTERAAIEAAGITAPQQ